MVIIYVGNVDSTYLCTYLHKSAYICYLAYLPSPIPTPPTPQRPPPPETSSPGAGFGGGGDGAWEVGEVADVARLA